MTSQQKYGAPLPRKPLALWGCRQECTPLTLLAMSKSQAKAAREARKAAKAAKDAQEAKAE